MGGLIISSFVSIYGFFTNCFTTQKSGKLIRPSTQKEYVPE